MDQKVNALAAQLAQMAQPKYTPSTTSQGVITGWDNTGSPPTVSLTLSGGATVVASVRYLDSYSPVVGDSVLVLKQGGALVVVGQIHNDSAPAGWTAPALQAGFTTGRPGQAPVQYREIVVAGQRKVEWRGAVTRTSGTLIVGAGLPVMLSGYGRALPLITSVGVLEVDFFSDECGLLTGSPAWISFDGVSYYL